MPLFTHSLDFGTDLCYHLLVNVVILRKNKIMLGTIFDIKEFSVHDGPGVRTTVFLKGCPLRCKWCHNPEGLLPYPQIMVKESQCIHCNACYTPCTHEVCKPYGRCLVACPMGLITLAGKEMDSAEVAAKVLKGKDFLRMSAGGVTISGGEPLMQPDFTIDLLKIMSELHRAIQTSGFADSEVFERVISNADYIMMDLKLIDSEKHRMYTGVDNKKILKNAEILKKSGKKHVFRVPLIPDITDTEENLRAISEVAGESEVELLPYNAMAGAKYKSVGMEYPLDGHKSENNKIDLSIFKRGKLL